MILSPFSFPQENSVKQHYQNYNMMLIKLTERGKIMRPLLVTSLIFISTILLAEQDQRFLAAPEPPELPMPVQSGEELEPDITIIRKGKKTIQEYRKNGQLYMVKVIPAIGPAYYLIDTDGDGTLDVRGNDLDKGTQINQWKLLEWD